MRGEVGRKHHFAKRKSAAGGPFRTSSQASSASCEYPLGVSHPALPRGGAAVFRPPHPGSSFWSLLPSVASISPRRSHRMGSLCVLPTPGPSRRCSSFPQCLALLTSSTCVKTYDSHDARETRTDVGLPVCFTTPTNNSRGLRLRQIGSWAYISRTCGAFVVCHCRLALWQAGEQQSLLTM